MGQVKAAQELFQVLRVLTSGVNADVKFNARILFE
jgi:hypothetical protein